MSRGSMRVSDRPELEGRFGLRRFLQSAGVLSITSVANFARAVIAAKLFAVTLGPSNLGILAQLMNFSAFVSVILPLGLTTGVVKMVAEGRSDHRQVTRVAVTTSSISFTSAVVGSLVLVAAATPISTALTGSSRYSLPVVLLVCSFPFYNIAAVLGYVLQGLGEIGRLTWANIITSLLAVVLLVPLTLFYGLTGAMAAVLTTSLVQVAVFGVGVWGAYAQRRWGFEHASFDKRAARQLLGYGGVSLLSAAATWGSLLVVRTLTLQSLGREANGLYQAVFGLSNQYLTVFLTWMGAYVFPRVVAEGQTPRLGSLLNSSLRANLAIMVPIFVISISLRDPLIRIFYSSSFIAAAPLIPIQVVGDYVRVVGWSFAVALFAIGYTRGHLLVIATQAVCWVALSAALIPSLGLSAVPLTYAISCLAFPLLGIALLYRWRNVAPDLHGLALTALGLVCVLGSLAPLYLGLLLAPVLPAAVYVLNRRELRSA